MKIMWKKLITLKLLVIKFENEIFTNIQISCTNTFKYGIVGIILYFYTKIKINVVC